MAQQIQLRRGTAAVAATANVVLAPGEPGLETDTGRIKIGDGTTPWNDLPYSILPPGKASSIGLAAGLAIALG